jgi:hypothetical protein
MIMKYQVSILTTDDQKVSQECILDGALRNPEGGDGWSNYIYKTEKERKISCFKDKGTTSSFKVI